MKNPNSTPDYYGLDPDVLHDELTLLVKQVTQVLTVIDNHALPGNDQPIEQVDPGIAPPGSTVALFKRRLATTFTVNGQRLLTLAEILLNDSEA